MQNLLSNITLQINKNIYLKDPETSELGHRIISNSIDLIDKIGFESFTFRKLGKAIDSTEASIYRYFESKHKLLLYLSCRYWAWMEYRLVFGLANIESPKQRLEKAITMITAPMTLDSDFEHIDEQKLHNIVVAESSKSYLTKQVDEENKVGIFSVYKQLVGRVSEIILEINPKYKYPHMLVSSVIEGTHHQRFFADHLPSLTDVIDGEDSITEYYKDMVFKSIGI